LQVVAEDPGCRRHACPVSKWACQDTNESGLVMQEALHKCTHASHSLKACYPLTHLKMALSWPVQVSNMESWCTAQPQGCAANEAVAWLYCCSCACLHRSKKVVQAVYSAVHSHAYHLSLSFGVKACLMFYLDSCGATTTFVWPGGAAKARGLHHHALNAQHQHSSMRNEDQYLIQIYSQRALTSV